MARNDRKTADWIAAIGEPTRITIIRNLASGKKTVTELAKLAGVEIVNVSHHLGVMRAAGVVKCEKQGRFIIYELANASFNAADGIVVLTSESGVEVALPRAVAAATNDKAA